MRKLFYNLLLVTFLLSTSNFLMAQKPNKALLYMKSISKQYKKIDKETWDYINSMAHSKSAIKVNKNRTILINTISKAITEVKALPPFENDSSLRDSVVAFFTLNYQVINNDFDKIIDMEAVAEQSFDLMEAYILAQELANDKLNLASDRMEIQYNSFAKKNNINIVDSEDQVTKNLKKSSEALNYYNKIYLVFFKAYKQELYLLAAIEQNDINSIEQNRDALSIVSTEGIEKLKALGSFKGDKSINVSCSSLLTFYKDEANNKIPILTEFLQSTAEFDKLMALMNSKDKNALTQDEIDKYNKAVEHQNKAIKKFNSTNNDLNNSRNKYLNSWNNSVNSFMTKNIPKK